MKRLLTILLAGLMTLTLCACGGGNEEPGGAVFTTDAVAALVEGGAFSEELEELDAAVAFVLYRLGDYGLSGEDLTEAAVVRSAGATCEEGAVLVFAEGADMSQVRQAMEDYLQSQIDGNVNYRPNEIPKLEAAVLECRENTVLLVVAGDLDKANELLKLH